MSSEINQATGLAAGLNQNQWSQINQATAALNPQQLTWLSGYLAGLAQNGQPAVIPQSDSAPAKFLTILYGSQTGNAKSVAQEYKAKLDALNVPAKVVSMADYKLKQLKTETHVAIIVSTHGIGEAPDDAVILHSFLSGKKAPKLNNLNFAVLGLGDTSYEFFCQTAKDFDKRLQDLGATRITDRVDCDVDYDSDVATWFDTVIHQVKDELGAKSSQSEVPSLNVSDSALDVIQYTKKAPYTAKLLESLKITGRDSVKDIRHIEISLEDSGIQYRPGDALGVWFKNDSSLVDVLITMLDVESDAMVNWSGDDFTSITYWSIN